MATWPPKQPKNPFPKKEEPKALARIIRPDAAFRWTGQMLASITPQYVEMVLRGALAGDHVRQWELFDLMEDTWPRLRKNANEIKDAVCNLARTFEPWCEEDEEPTPKAEEKARLVSAALRGMKGDPVRDEHGFAGLIREILDARCKGVSVQELGWESRSAGKLGDIVAPRAAWWVHPSCYAWSPQGWLGLAEEQPAAYARGQSVTEFPPDKFVVSVYKSKSGSPLGAALLRPLAWWWCASTFSADWLLNLAQVFGLPFRWANYENNATQSTVDAICDMLANMGSAGWAAFPAGTTLELKAEGQKSGDATPQGNMLDRADKQCDLLLLGQTLTGETGDGGKGGGSLALGKVHEGVKYEIVMAAAEFAETVINEQVIPSILRLNYPDASECPRLVLASEDEGDLTKDSQIVSTLAGAGAGDIIGLDWLGKKFNIPKPGPQERTLGQVKAEAAARAAERMKSASGEDTEKEGPGALKKLEAISRIADDSAFDQALKAFSADQLRDRNGRWTTGGMLAPDKGGAFGEADSERQKRIAERARKKAPMAISEQREIIREVVARADDPEDREGEDFGAVSPAAEEKAKAAGADISGFTKRIEPDLVRHNLLRHSDPAVELSRNQLPISKSDYDRIPEVLDTPDSVSLGESNEDGQKTLWFSKTFKGNQRVLVTVRQGRRRLAFKGMKIERSQPAL